MVVGPKTIVFTFIAVSALPSSSAWGQAGPIRARVVEVRPQRGEARLSLSAPATVRAGDRGEIQSRTGPVEFEVRTVDGPDRIVVNEVRRDRFQGVNPGDVAVFFPGPESVRQETRKALESLDALLSATGAESIRPPERAPDLLSEVTGEVLLEYEAWLLELESETLDLPGPRFEEKPVPVFPVSPAATPLPSYPNLRNRQTLRTGVDFDRFVFHATQELTAPRVTENQLNRYLRWNYIDSGEYWKGRRFRFENELELNQDFLYEEMSYFSEWNRENGDRSWWENRSVWKLFNNEQGESFLFDDFEARSIRKLDENWEWQRGIRLEGRTGYDAERDSGYVRGSFLSEWNYREGFERRFDVLYEFTGERRNDSERWDRNFLEHRLEARYYSFGDEWNFDWTGSTHYRDYDQLGRREDEWTTQSTATLRKTIHEDWTCGIRGTIEPRVFRFTEDSNSNALRIEAAPFAEYTRGAKLFLTLEPRAARVFHFGDVPGDIDLDVGLPRDKSDGNYNEVGLNVSLSWFPNAKWRVSLFEDVSHRWFPEGETGRTAFYLYDFPRLADSTGHFASLSIGYIESENFELSLRASHSKTFYDVFDENETSSFNVGLEAVYRF